MAYNRRFGGVSRPAERRLPASRTPGADFTYTELSKNSAPWSTFSNLLVTIHAHDHNRPKPLNSPRILHT
jgi:hypothetical protein